MKNIIYLSFLTLFLFSCATNKKTVSNNTVTKISSKKITYSGGDGSSYKNAIIINSENSREGIAAEYDYVDKKYGIRGLDWQFIQQTLSHENNKSFDILTIKYKEKQFDIYFDISKFFGKY